MRRIYKYYLAPSSYISNGEELTQFLLVGAQILTVSVDPNAHAHPVVLWALVDIENPNEDRTFVIYGTGYDFLAKHEGGLKHIASFSRFSIPQVPPGANPFANTLSLMFHVFEKVKP